MSGESVANRIMSMSPSDFPARSRAFFAARAPRSDDARPSSANRRCSIPVRLRIHSSDVSIPNRAIKSSFVTTVSGTYPPVPEMKAWGTMRLRDDRSHSLPR
jgi:hypothetical protein